MHCDDALITIGASGGLLAGGLVVWSVVAVLGWLVTSNRERDG